MDVWILSEVEDVKETISLLKKISTGEMVDSDKKYEGRIKGKPHVLPVIDCNEAFDYGDDSWGRLRRDFKLDFPYIFGYTAGTRKKDPL
jgi:phage/plasmid-associated DNA primase